MPDDGFHVLIDHVRRLLGVVGREDRGAKLRLSLLGRAHHDAISDFLAQQDLLNEMQGLGDNGHFVEIRHLYGHFRQHIIAGVRDRVATLMTR
jgi:hypothetical protein